MLHLRGMMYPSKPGFTAKFGMMLLQERHCIAIFVALALIPDALTMIPGTLTNRDTTSDCNIIYVYIHEKQ